MARLRRHALRVERHWLPEKRSSAVGGSHAAPSTASPTVSSVGPWRLPNWKVDHLLIWKSADDSQLNRDDGGSSHKRLQ